MNRTGAGSVCFPWGLAFLVPLLVAHALRAQDKAEVRQEIVSLETQDGRRPGAVYHYLPGRQPKTAVLVMHPRVDMRMHFVLDPLARLGLGALGMAPRTPGCTNIHEELLLDVAAGVKFLRGRGVQHIVLIGHSGGGSLMAYYQAQAETGPPNRIRHTPAGDPPDLNKFDLLRADGFVMMNAHEGEGLHTTHHLDPSITDEDDPFSYDPSLDMYNPDNGFRLPPEVSHYSPEFLERLAKAQQERGRRLVEKARGYVREQNFYRDLMKSAAFQEMSLKDRLIIERRAQFERPFPVHRMRADPRYYDLSLDPNDRTLGRGSTRNDLDNWGRESMPCLTARTFLSTQSIVSNARLWDNLGKISVPVLVINSSADPGIHPSEAKKTFASAASKDKERVWIIGGNHGFLPEGPQAGKGDQREQCLRAIAHWMQKRWPL